MNFTIRHKEKKRKKEICKIIKIIDSYLDGKYIINEKNLNILEFGCGNGFQTRYLQKIGNVKSIDIHYNKEIQNRKNVLFTEASIENTPFKNREFDIVFSNHVIEHLENIPAAFIEIDRISKKSSLIVFSIPTNIWLLFSIPAQLLNKFKPFLRSNNKYDKIQNKDNKVNKYSLLRLLPKGHGIEKNFLKCYNSFRIKSWKQFFIDNGFNIINYHPLYFYVPSSFPYFPTTEILSKYNFCSSVLFILRKN